MEMNIDMQNVLEGVKRTGKFKATTTRSLTMQSRKDGINTLIFRNSKERLRILDYIMLLIKRCGKNDRCW